MSVCPVCGNKDVRYFSLRTQGEYCRKCVMFISNLDAEEGKRDWDCGDEQYRLDYPLTSHQQIASDQIRDKAMQSDVLVDAVCGAGKTELVLGAIEDALLARKKVGWAIPRRQVVLELRQRLSAIFPSLVVVAVCQGYTEKTDGDLILCTTHQLYRYKGWFDLLILDEPDAFPYKGNEMLANFARNACCGKMIFLTATPDDQLIQAVNSKDMTLVKLNARPHGYPVIVPKVKLMPGLMCLLFLIRVIRDKRSWLIFVPTRKTARWLSWILQIDHLTSQSENKDEIIERFRLKETRVMVATTILERGVTFADVNVIVLFSDHPVFDTASLIQISGRVGRSFSFPKGECLFLSRSKTLAVNDCLRKIEEANQSVFGV
jgi:competence protein ComFA